MNPKSLLALALPLAFSAACATAPTAGTGPMGPDKVVYSSANAGGSFIDRLGPFFAGRAVWQSAGPFAAIAHRPTDRSHG